MVKARQWFAVNEAHAGLGEMVVVVIQGDRTYIRDIKETDVDMTPPEFKEG